MVTFFIKDCTPVFVSLLNFKGKILYVPEDPVIVIV